jgi:hypothetical protein
VSCDCRSKLIVSDSGVVLGMDQWVSAACSAGSVILCESEYTCLKLFKKRKTLFFATCQSAILFTALETALTGSIYFVPSLRILPVFIIIALFKGITDVSYPMMMLLRLRLLCRLHPIIICIPILQGILWTGLRYFWISLVTGNDYNRRTFIIIRVISTITVIIQDIAINVFFIVLARKKKIVHVRCVIIVNVIVILLTCVLVVTQFVSVPVWVVVSVVNQVMVRLEIEVLANIVLSLVGDR